MDVIVVGGGMAGVSLGYELAEDREVTVLEAEDSLAVHTTGRSAATWIGTIGPAVVRSFTHDSLALLCDPPFEVDGPVATPMACLTIGVAGEEDAVRQLVAVSEASYVEGAELARMCPILRPHVVTAGAWDNTAKNLDVMALHHGYVRALRSRGGVVRTSSRVAAATRKGGDWVVTTTTGEVHRAPVVVDAAGAWGDVVGAVFGAEPVGLEPRRRTIFQSPTAADLTGVPFTLGIDNSFYLKPENTTVLASPQDETPQEPGDAKPDEIDIARGMEAVNEVTTLDLRSVRTAWAGLRTFAPDGEPVARWDERVEGFFWFVGQAGYGIQMSPALARHGAALIRAE